MVTDAAGHAYLYYGSYFGGVQVRDLDVRALTDPATAKQVVIPNRLEGTFVARRGGWYYLMGSATDWCRGPLTGYSVFAGRSRSPRGPFVDRLGVPLTARRAGGTPVISINGNRWVGPGHNSVVTDAAGQDWFAYHAIDRGDPYLDPPNPLNINKRPMLLDRLDWVGGWPSARGRRSRPSATTARAGGCAARRTSATWLRIVRRGHRYTAYSSIDGRRWVRGGTWTHDLPGARLALFAMGGPGGHVAEFDYVRVFRAALSSLRR